MQSAFYEMDRIPQVRGQFGQHPVPALVVASSPLLVLIMALSALNYIIMGRVLKKAADGPVLYHRFEIGCDFAMALISVAPFLNLSVIADWLNFVFVGKQQDQIPSAQGYELRT